MNWLLYNIVFFLAYLLLLPRFLHRMWRRGGYRRDFQQRFGRYEESTLAAVRGRKPVWIHAVSVGEIFVALRYIETLRAQRPDRVFVVSTTTSTGHRVAQDRMDARDVLIYCPSDFPPFVRRALDAIDPCALILTESEFWPNLIRLAHARGIPLALINGRISDSSFRGYWVIRRVMRDILNRFDILLVQTAQDRERLAALGAPMERIEVIGTAKYDLTVVPTTEAGRSLDAAVSRLGIHDGVRLIVGGSTWPGEEAILLNVFKRLRGSADLRLILIPRHAERAGEVAREIEKTGLRWGRRSTLGSPAAPVDEPVDVLLVDTTGEVMSFYAKADIVFVGKSLLHHGGQNIIEPAALGKVIVTGPHLENFPVVADEFASSGALFRVRDEAALEEILKKLLEDDERRIRCGQCARALVEEKRGVVDEGVRRICVLLDGRPEGGE